MKEEEQNGSTGDLPYWIDDPLMDRAAHQLNLQSDLEVTAKTGWPSVFGSCSCGEWVTPSWDNDAVFGAFDEHMQLVQESAHESANRDATR